MITKSDLIADLGSVSAVARIAGCTKQAVSQWQEKVPVRSAILIARNSKNVTVHDLRPDIFGPAPAERDAAKVSARQLSRLGIAGMEGEE